MAPRKTIRKTTKSKTPIKERTPGQIKSLQNLKQFNNSDLKEQVKVIKQEIEIPISPEMEKGINKSISPTVRAVLNNDEYKLFVKEVIEWVEDHPDWNSKEDLDDINAIAMEKVIQYRLLLKKKRRMSTDIEKDYSSSAYRVQAFRQNLAARRADRLNADKNKQSNVTNIAFIASQIDDNRLRILSGKNQKEQEEEDKLFPIMDIESEEIEQGD